MTKLEKMAERWTERQFQACRRDWPFQGPPMRDAYLAGLRAGIEMASNILGQWHQDNLNATGGSWLEGVSDSWDEVRAFLNMDTE